MIVISDVHSVLESLVDNFAKNYRSLAIKTPVNLEYNNYLSADLGRTILIKREDSIDVFGSGNKLRKLHYIISKAKQQGIDTLITLGSLPSNQCKAVARISHLHGMRAHVIYGGDTQSKPKTALGSYLLTSLFDPEISWFEFTPWANLAERLDEIFIKEKDNGYKPYIIHSGASDWPGIVGSIELGLELALQLQENNIKKVDIICAAGSAGTAVGLQIVAEILDLDCQLHGICIGESRDFLMPKAQKLRQESYLKLGQPCQKEKRLQLYDCALGSGYDMPSIAELEIMKQALKKYDLILDCNYMLKTFIGMIKILNAGFIRDNSTIVLIHTGGQTGLFDNNYHFNEWHCNTHPAWTM